jgi:uncharacterized protein DUF4242
MLELARPPDGWARLPQLTDAGRSASERLKRAGVPVRFVRSIFVPEDDTCFHLYQAASAGAVREAAENAGTGFRRIHAADASAIPVDQGGQP